MRATLLGLSLVLALATLPAPAAALSGCNGAWNSSAQCAFSCNDVNLYVRGFAQDFSGTGATVTVTAECGLVASSGVFVPLYSVSCSASGGATASCFATGPHLLFPTPLAGRCSVTGNTAGFYDCLSAP